MTRNDPRPSPVGGSPVTVTSTTGTAPIIVSPGNDGESVCLTLEDGSSQMYKVANVARTLVQAVPPTF